MKYKQDFKLLQKSVKSTFDVWFLYSFLIVFFLKLSYLLINSYSVEVDSYGYFVCVLHFEYPPVYPYFLYILRNIYPNLFFIAFVQVVLFSLSSAFLLRYLMNFSAVNCKRLIGANDLVYGHFIDSSESGNDRSCKLPEMNPERFNKKGFLLLAAIIMGLEPVTSFLCSNMMSECLFLTILFPWLILIYNYFQERENSRVKILLIGVLSGILYSIRFAGLLFVIFPLLLLITDKFKRKELFLSLLLMFLGFQTIILPIRIKYKTLFDTYKINSFTGAVLWNNASTIYLSSKVYKNPETDFEKYLTVSNTSVFSQNKALKGRQLWDAGLPYRKYISDKGYHFQDYPKVSEEVMVTAITIIMDHPYLYFKNYVIPNFLQVFLEDEYIDISAYRNYYQSTFTTSPTRTVVYHRYYWLFYFSLLIISTAIYLLRRNRLLFCKITLGLSWFYILVLPFISILAIRLYFILVPFIVLSLLLQIRFLRESNALSKELNGTN